MCISSHHSSPCSTRSASSLLTACVKQKMSSDENLYELYKRHPSEYAPFPKRQRYPWMPLTPEIYRHDVDLKSSYFRRKPLTDPSRYTWMPSDDESVRMEKPKSILDMSYRNQVPSNTQTGKKHVSFARSHTLTSFDDAMSSLTSSSSHLNRITRSQERLLEVRKAEEVKAITKQPESENVVILDKIKRAPMKTQATQTEVGLGRKPINPGNIHLSPRTIQKVKMVSQAAQTNGYNGRKLAKSLSEANNKLIISPSKEFNFFEPELDHEPLQRTQSDEPPRSPFFVMTPPTAYLPTDNPGQSETSSLSQKSEDHESEDSVESKQEIFIDFKPQVPPAHDKRSKRPLVKTASDGVILVHQRKNHLEDDGVVPNIKKFNSISHENIPVVEEQKTFTPYFQKAPIRNEGICKPLEDNIYSSTDVGLFTQDSIDEEFHESFIFNKNYINRQDSQNGTIEARKSITPQNDEGVVPSISLRPELKLSPFTSNDDIRDQSDGNWNESQVTVLQADSGTDNGTPFSSSEVVSASSPVSINLLTPASRRKELLILQHQQRSSMDIETLDEELGDTQIQPQIIVDKLTSKLEVPSPVSPKQSPSLLKVSHQRTSILLNRPKRTDSPPIQLESPLPAVVPDLLLARTDSCKTNTDVSESTTTDDYITANSGTDSSKKSGSYKVVPSLSPSYSSKAPPEPSSVAHVNTLAPIPQIISGRSTPSEDSSSCGSYSVGTSIPDLLDRYSIPSGSPNKTWHGSDDERSVHYSSSGYYESPIEDEFTLKTPRHEEYSRSKKRREFHLELTTTSKPQASNKPKLKYIESKNTPSNENQKFLSDKVKRSKSRTRSPMQGQKKSIQGRRSPYKEKTIAYEEKNYKATSDESSTGREYAGGQSSPRKNKKSKDNNRRRSLPRSPVTQKSEKRISSDYQPSSLPGSLCRRKSFKQSKSLQSINLDSKKTSSKSPAPQKNAANSSKDTTTLKALSAESLRSVSPGSDSVFYSDPSSHTTDHQIHCLHCGKEVDIATDEADKSISSNGNQPDIVRPPAGFEDSPKIKPGRLFKKLDKRLKSEERSQAEGKRNKYRPDARAKSEERSGAAGGVVKSKLRPMARSPFCSKEQLKTANSSPSILPGDPEEEDDQGVYNVSYTTGLWLYVDERDELQSSNILSPTDQEQIRRTSISSTESEQDFRKRYQAITHRMVHRKSCLEMYKKQTNKSFECDKTVVVHRESGEFGFRIHGSKPVVVSAIEPGTPAESSGLEVGDIVLSVNGVSVLDKSHSEVVKIAHAGSDTLTLEVARTCYALNTSNDEHTDNHGCYSGYLWKLSGYASGTMSNKWIRRWFCLKQNNCLYYYKTDSEKQPVGVVMLFEHDILTLNDDENGLYKPYRFVVQREDSVPLHLAADTEGARSRWVEVIGKAIHDSYVVDEFLDQTKRNLNLPPSNINEPDCFGYLIKLGNQWKSWSRRYCVLKDACLYFYLDANASSAFGVAYLHGYRVQQSSSGSKKHAFEIVPPETGQKSYYFHAESETDKKRWITAVEYSIDKWLKVK